MILDLILDPIFQSVLASVVLAQFLKTLIDWRSHGHFHWQSLFRGAGMPSSHTATVISLALAVFFVEGVNTIFIVTFVVAAIVVRDVIGDKVFATHQERIINKLVQQLISHEKIEWKHLIGHTLTEVFAGMLLGILVTLGVFYLNNLL